LRHKGLAAEENIKGQNEEKDDSSRDSNHAPPVIRAVIIPLYFKGPLDPRLR